MATALKLPSRHMTVAEFLDWDSGDRSGALWLLRDGEPEMMSPASDRHGTIQAHLAIADHSSSLPAAALAGLSPRLASSRACGRRRTA